MVRIVERVDYTDEEMRKANRILYQISKVVENAFSEFDTKWDFLPRSFVQSFTLNIIIGGIIFDFKVNIGDPLNDKFIAPEVKFQFGGYQARIHQITPQVASSILAASKIAQRLKKEITQVLKRYGE